jgi:hypothetical protein
MIVRLQKPWAELTNTSVANLPGQLGVYELADSNKTVVYVGYAGGRSLFGLRSELQRWLTVRAGELTYFRYEVNMQYISRYKELLMVHVADHHGKLPLLCTDVDQKSLGRLMPMNVR